MSSIRTHNTRPDVCPRCGGSGGYTNDTQDLLGDEVYLPMYCDDCCEHYEAVYKFDHTYYKEVIANETIR